jgi:hypothetical protein
MLGEPPAWTEKGMRAADFHFSLSSGKEKLEPGGYLTSDGESTRVNTSGCLVLEVVRHGVARFDSPMH